MGKPSFKKAVLSNGITIVAERHDAVHSASVAVWVKVGSSSETLKINGISHLIEHMVFKGTKKRSAFEIATCLESLGGDLNAFTDRESTCYHATVLSEHTEVALDVLSDLVLFPTFPVEEFEKERKVLLQELSMVQDSPEDWIHDVHLRSVWPKSPIGYSVIGSKKTLKSITREQVLKYFKTFYTPSNMVVSISGNVEFEKLFNLCEKYFNGVSGQKLPVKKEQKPKYKAVQLHEHNDVDQMHLIVSYEGISYQDAYRFDALILSFYLGGGMSSRLFQEVREKAGLAYTVECEFTPYATTGLFSIYAAMDPKTLEQCAGILSRELNLLKTTPLTQAQLENVKNQLKGAILLSSDQMDTRQESIARNEILFGKYVTLEDVIRDINSVTSERIQELSQRIFVKKKESIITLGKKKPKKGSLKVV